MSMYGSILRPDHFLGRCGAGDRKRISFRPGAAIKGKGARRQGNEIAQTPTRMALLLYTSCSGPRQDRCDFRYPPVATQESVIQPYRRYETNDNVRFPG